MIVALAATSGCSTVQHIREMRQSMGVATGLEAPPPAHEFLTCWQNKLQTLPDPTKSGAQIAGLPGQMFLFTADMKPAVPQGELTIVVEDETPRPQGSPVHRPEVWHFTKDKLEKMVAVDERFGKNLVLFVPWPPEWRDVSKIRIKSSYTQPMGQKTIYSPESSITLDFTGQTGSGGWRPMTAGSATAMGVPNANQVIQQMTAQAAAARPNPPPGMPAPQQVVPAGYVMPTKPAPQQPMMQQPMMQQPMMQQPMMQQPVATPSVQPAVYSLPSASAPIPPTGGMVMPTGLTP
jgi:hypothetical protein